MFCRYIILQFNQQFIDKWKGIQPNLKLFECVNVILMFAFDKKSRINVNTYS